MCYFEDGNMFLIFLSYFVSIVYGLKRTNIILLDRNHFYRFNLENPLTKKRKELDNIDQYHYDNAVFVYNIEEY